MILMTFVYSLQIPCNAVLPKLRPRFVLPSAVCLWGAVVCFMALVNNHSALFGLRICLGFAEAVSGCAIFPNTMIQLSQDQRISTLQQRSYTDHLLYLIWNSLFILVWYISLETGILDKSLVHVPRFLLLDHNVSTHCATM